MKIYVKVLGLLLLAGTTFMTSCDKVEYPNVIITDLDTSIYPGNFVEYDYPTFEENTNTLRNVVITDYTGHQCPFCPPAAAKAKEIEEANPGRVFIATIHASAEAGGAGDFQKVTDEYPREFKNTQGLEMASEFFNLGVGFNSNPRGTVNRVPKDDGFYFMSHSNWPDLTAEVLATDLDINIQAKSNYFTETNGVFLHVETEFINDIDGAYNIVVYALENSVISPQKQPDGSRIADYEHHDIHLGNLYEETWGRPISSGTTVAGSKFQNDFSYRVPSGLTNEDVHFLVLVYNRETYEIKQVIKHEF